MPNAEFKIFESPEVIKPPKQKTREQIKARQYIARLENPDTIKIPEYSENSFGVDEKTLKLFQEKFPEEWPDKLSDLSVFDEETKQMMIKELLY